MSVDDAWPRALELAWASFLAGTTPVGAVVTGPDGTVVAEGRGRRYEEPDGTGRQLAYCHVAHAEINALAGLPPTRHYDDHVLLTTLEPCCMCLGAAVQSTITDLRFAGRDPYGGAAELQIRTPQARRRPLRVTGPLPGPRGWFAELLHVRWLIEHGASRPVMAALESGIPDICQAAAGQAADTIFRRLKRDRADASDAIAAVQALA